MRAYLDNCCFNRPYDDQSNITISLETQAKLYIQNLISQGKIEMATSYMLLYENGYNPYEMRKKAIKEYIEQNTTVYVSVMKQDIIVEKAREIMKTGVKYKDACHVSCALLAECDFFITTDKRLLKYNTDKIKMMNPLDFVKELEV
jgi:predicted nucleic acid-binding protein